jgi:hypothetical protein
MHRYYSTTHNMKVVEPILTGKYLQSSTRQTAPKELTEATGMPVTPALQSERRRFVVAEEETAAPASPAEASQLVEAGNVSRWLTENGFEHESLEADHQRVEIVKVERDYLLPISTALYAYGFNYLQYQCAYDLGPGQDLVSVYHLIKLSDNADQPEEIRLKVFLPRKKI